MGSLAVAGACLALACGQGGQPARGRNDLRVETGTVRMTDLPPYAPNGEGSEEEEEAPTHAPPLDFAVPPGARAHGKARGEQAGTAREALSAGTAAASFTTSTSPAPAIGFLAMAMSANWPPDTNGAVGPNHVVSTTNDQIVIHDRLGNVLASTALDTFWGASWSDIAPAWDPNLRYDPYADRFIFVCMANFGKAGSSLLVAVTATSDPTGLWYQRRIYADPSTTIDHPRVGFNGKWIAVTGNTLTGTNLTFAYVNMFAFDKADLYANGTKAPVKFGNLANVHTLTPALTYDPAVETLYLVSNYNGNDTSASPAMGYLALSTLTGPVGAEVLNLNVAFPGTANTWASTLPSPPNLAPQAGSCPKIGVFDARMNTLVYRNGSLWATHTVFLPAAAPTISAVDWWQIGTDGSVQQFGRITDPTGVYFYDYPSLAVNAQGDMLIGYSRMAATEYATAAYALRTASDPPGTVRQEFVARPGAGPYCLLDGGGANRWGDYSVSQVDPVDDTQLWTLQEFAAGTTSSQWGTWWVSVPPPEVSAVLQALSLSPSTVTGGQGATGTVTIGSGAPAGGLVVALSSGSPVAQVPASVTIPAGATSATFAIATTAVAASTPVPIMATAGGVTQSVPLNVEGPDGYALAVSSRANRSGAVALNGALLSGNAYVFTSYAANAQDPMPAGITGVCYWLDDPSMSGAAIHCEGTAPWDFAGTYGLTYNNIGNPWNTATLPDGPHAITQVVTRVGGATEAETATFTIANASALLALGVSPGDLTSGQSATGTVTLSAAAPSTGLTIGLSSNNTAAQPPAAVTVPAGATSATFTVSTGTVGTATTATLAATLGLAVQTATVTVHPATTFSVSVSPVSVTAGQSSTGTITLGAPAPAGGAAVALSSSSSAAAQVPSLVTVPAGSSRITFTITTGPVGASVAVTISATYGAATQSTVLTVTPPVALQALTVTPSTVMGGQSSAGTVTLTGPAPSGGALVALSSGNAAAQVPASVTVPAGAASATFGVTTSPVAGSTAVPLSATYGGATLSATLTVTPTAAVGVVQAQQAFNPNTATTVTAAITTTPGNLLVAFVREGSSATDAFTVSDSLGQAWKLAGYNSFSSVERCGTFYMPSSGAVTSVTASFTTGGGVVRPGIVVYEISGADPTAPLDVGTIGTTLTQAGTSITSAALSTTSATDILLFAVDVSANQTGFTPGAGFAFPGTGSAVTARQAVAYQVVSSQQSNLVTSATWPASATAASQFVAFKAAPPPAPAAVQSVAVSPSAVTGGQGSTGTVTLTAAAPAGGAVVNLSSGSASAQVPASVTVPAGGTSATFAISTSAVTVSTAVTVSATYGSVTQTATLTVNPPPAALQGVAVSPSTVTGGQGSTGTASLTSAAPAGGAVVSLSSGSASAQIPASVTCLVCATTATFAVTTSVVAVSTAVTVSATYGTVTQTATLTVLPAALQSVSVSPSTVTGGQSSTGTVTLSGAAPAGGVVVSLSSGDVSAQVPASVTVPAGAATATFAINTGAVSVATAAIVSATYGGITQTSVLTVEPPVLQSVAVSPSTVNGGQDSTGTVSLTAAAPSGGAVVSLSSSSASAQVPPLVTVPAGSTSVTFVISTSPVTAPTAVTVSAAYGSATQTATLTVNPPPAALQGVAVSPSTVTGGQSSTGTVSLSSAAPAGGAVVSLSSGSASAQVPASVTVPAGATTATFAVTTSVVAVSTAVTVSATYGTVTQTATLTVLPAALQSVSVSPSTVTGGQGSTGTVALSGAAPAGGAVISLSSGDVSAQVPASVTVPAGATSATFAVATSAVATSAAATISATFGAVTRTVTLTVLPATLQSIAVSPFTVTGGQGATGTVTLTGAAPAGGAVVSLSSGDLSTQVPASVTVPAGSTSATFAIATGAVPVATAAIVSATYAAVTQTTVLTVEPPALQSVAVSPSTVTGGQGATGTVTLTGPAPSGGAALSLSSSSASAQVPPLVTVLAGTTSATFAITTSAVAASTAVTLSATYGTATQAATLTLLPPPAALQGVALSPSTVTGGQGSTGVVTLTSPAPTGGAVVGLSSGDVSTQVPVSVTVPAGATSATFVATTSAVAVSTSVTVSATYGAVTQTATLTVLPAALQSVAVSPSAVTGGQGATGTVTLSGAAPASGATVLLSSGGAAAQVPASVTVAAGASSATFGVTTSAVTTSTPVTLSATYGAATVSTTLTVNAKAPPSVVQARQNFTGNNRQTSVTVSIATTPGNLLVAFVREGSNATDAFTVTDSLGQTWTPVGYGSFSSVERCGLFYVPASGAVTSVTARFTTVGGVVRPGIVVYEISGASPTSPLDAGPATSTLTQNVASITSGPLTTTSAADLLLFAVDVSNNQSGFTPGAGFAFPTTGSAVDARQAVAYRAVSSPQTGFTTSMTWPSGAAATSLFAAFR